MQAKGTFSVTLSPEASGVSFKTPAQFGRMTIDKTFSGDLSGHSTGEMLSCRSAQSPSAGYVALEQFSGTLGDRQGSFVLQHYGVMTADSQHLTLEVLPDSGTDQLQDISGRMNIDIRDSQHYYQFDYQFG